MELKTTVEHSVKVFGGKEFPVTITRVVGLATYFQDGKEILVDAATFIDCGKYGVIRNFTLHKDEPPTQEEREAGRRHIQEVAARALAEQGIW